MATPYRFDDDWIEEATLHDGSHAQVRRVRPSDAALLREGFRRLSPQSRYLRFLGPRDHLSDDDLHYLTDVDGVHHFALGAVRVDEIGREEGLGVARFVRLESDPEVAEPAVTVIDSAQGKGLGTLLLARLIEAAIERGVRRFRCEFLTDNVRVQELFRDTLRSFPGASLDLEDQGEVVRAEVALAESEPEAPPRDWLAAVPFHELLAEVASGRLVARLGRALLKWSDAERGPGARQSGVNETESED